MASEATEKFTANLEFHARENLFFKRGPGAIVIIQKRDDNAWSVTVDDYTWASIVASVTPLGETSETFRWAKNLHIRGVPEADAPA